VQKYEAEYCPYRSNASKQVSHENQEDIRHQQDQVRVLQPPAQNVRCADVNRPALAHKVQSEQEANLRRAKRDCAHF